MLMSLPVLHMFYLPLKHSSAITFALSDVFPHVVCCRLPNMLYVGYICRMQGSYAAIFISFVLLHLSSAVRMRQGALLIISVLSSSISPLCEK